MKLDYHEMNFGQKAGLLRDAGEKVLLTYLTKKTAKKKKEEKKRPTKKRKKKWPTKNKRPRNTELIITQNEKVDVPLAPSLDLSIP